MRSLIRRAAPFASFSISLFYVVALVSEGVRYPGFAYDEPIDTQQLWSSLLSLSGSEFFATAESHQWVIAGVLALSTLALVLERWLPKGRGYLLGVFGIQAGLLFVVPLGPLLVLSAIARPTWPTGELLAEGGLSLMVLGVWSFFCVFVTWSDYRDVRREELAALDAEAAVYWGRAEAKGE